MNMTHFAFYNFNDDDDDNEALCLFYFGFLDFWRMQKNIYKVAAKR